MVEGRIGGEIIHQECSTSGGKKWGERRTRKERVEEGYRASWIK